MRRNELLSVSNRYIRPERTTACEPSANNLLRSGVFSQTPRCPTLLPLVAFYPALYISVSLSFECPIYSRLECDPVSMYNPVAFSPTSHADSQWWCTTFMNVSCSLELEWYMSSSSHTDRCVLNRWPCISPPDCPTTSLNMRAS